MSPVPVDQCSRCDMPASVIEMTRPPQDGSGWMIEYLCNGCGWHWMALAGQADTDEMIRRAVPLEAG